MESTGTTINDFLANFAANGHLESNKFEVRVQPPSTLLPQADELSFIPFSAGSDGRHLTFRAESVNLAGRNISSFDETNIYGPVMQIPDGVTYAEDINITFIASETMFERDFFEKWQELIFDPLTWDLGYYQDFVGQIEIYTLSRSQKPGRFGNNFVRSYGIKCEEIYPKTIGPSELSMASGTEVIKIPMNFAFRYWDRIDTKFEKNDNNNTIT